MYGKGSNATWSAQNPILAAYAVVGTTGATILAAPGLVTAPVLSSLGFSMSGIQAGMCNLVEKSGSAGLAWIKAQL